MDLGLRDRLFHILNNQNGVPILEGILTQQAAYPHDQVRSELENLEDEGLLIRGPNDEWSYASLELE